MRWRSADRAVALAARPFDTERRHRADQRLFEVAAVALDVLAVPREIEDRVADELARPVVGRLSAAIGLDDLDVCAFRYVQLAGLGPPPERDHRRMLQQQNRVGKLAVQHAFGERALELPGLEVRHVGD